MSAPVFGIFYHRAHMRCSNKLRYLVQQLLRGFRFLVWEEILIRKCLKDSNVFHSTSERRTQSECRSLNTTKNLEIHAQVSQQRRNNIFLKLRAKAVQIPSSSY